MTIFYHGSSKPLKEKTIYKARKKSRYFGFGIETEKIVNKLKPKGSLSRTKALYMSIDPSTISMLGGYDTYVYEVKPLGKVLKADSAWILDIQNELLFGDKNINKIKKFIDAYYKGKKHPESEDHWEEYLTSSFEVIRPDKITRKKLQNEHNIFRSYISLLIK